MDSNRIFEDFSFTEVLGLSLKNWRKSLLIGLAFALAVVIFLFATGTLTFNSKITEEEYNEKYTVLNARLDRLTKSLQDQQDMLSNSIYYNINPTRATRGTITMFVKTPSDGTDYDYSKDVAYAYSTKFATGEMSRIVAQKLDNEIPEEYLEQIIVARMSTAANPEYSDNYIEISVWHYDESAINEIMAVVEEAVNEKKEEIEKIVGPFTLTKVSDSLSTFAYDQIGTDKQNAELQLASISDDIASVNSELESLKQSYYSGLQLKSAAVYTAIAFVLGTVFGLAAFMVLNVFSSKVKTSKQLSNSYKYTVLGDFVEMSEKPNVIDRAAYRLLKEPYNVSLEEMYNISAGNISGVSGGKNLLLVALGGVSDIEKLEENISKCDSLKEFNIESAYNIGCSSEALKKLRESDGAVAVVKKGKTALSDIDEFVKLVSDYKKEFVGIILE